jgi:hypothetical protein
MIAALLFAAMSQQGNVRTVEISRGAPIQLADSTAGTFGYWDTTDTYLDGGAPDDNFGGEPILSAGPSNTLLVRFGDLNRVLGSTRHIRKATLILTLAGGDKPKLKTVDRILVPWGAGPYFTVNALINRATLNREQQDQVIKAKPTAPHWSATWRRRLSGDFGAAWQQAGANGPQDSETISGVTTSGGDKEVAIEGLASSVQFLANHPTQNFGFGIQFADSCEFYSSRAAIGRPRLVLELEPEPVSSGPDLSVTTIERISNSGKAPSEGEEVTYKAHVKNVGTAKAAGFSATWLLTGKPDTVAEVADSLEPGAETTLTVHAPYHTDKSDHRTQTVELRIAPKGPDAEATNNALLIYQNARMIDVKIPDSLAAISAANLVGSTAIEDWVQEQVRVFNETYAAQSRFSFAPDGAKERISVQHIYTGNTPPADGAFAEATANIPPAEALWQTSDPEFLRNIGLAIGLPDFTSMSFAAGKKIDLKVDGKPLNRGSIDLYPGVIGYGDTRYEGVLAGPIGMVYEPFPSASSGLLPLVPSGLLASTDVAILNARVERSPDGLEMPKTTLIKASDIFGRPLNNQQLDFFQSRDGRIPDGQPTFSVTTSEVAGTALLPNPTGFGPFGKLTPNGGNGTFLIRATAHGVTEWGWLKAWQLIDSANRGNKAAGVMDVRFNLPSVALDPSVDLAKDRIITDSTNMLPAKLGPLVSGGTDKEVTLGRKIGDWVEIDLGRDRTIGEITLIGSPEAFWPQFDISVYSTGQKPSEASPWASELNWNWTASNRRDLVGSDSNIVSVAYRAPETRIRFIRIVNRSSSAGKLRAIRVVPIKISP